MTARNLYSNQQVEVFKIPRWLRVENPNGMYYFKKGSLYYLLEERNIKQTLLQQNAYEVSGIVYQQKILCSEKQFEVLKEIHSKCDGYIQLTIFDY